MRIVRLAAPLLATTVLTGLTLIGSPAAVAAETLPLNVAPAKGNALIRPTFVTTRPCPEGTTSYFPYLYGPGFPADGQPMANNPSDFALSTTQPFQFQADLTFRDTAARAGTSLRAGSHRITVICQDDLTNVLATFSRRIVFSSPAAFAVVGGPAPVHGAVLTERPVTGPGPGDPPGPGQESGALSSESASASDNRPDLGAAEAGSGAGSGPPVSDTGRTVLLLTAAVAGTATVTALAGRHLSRRARASA